MAAPTNKELELISTFREMIRDIKLRPDQDNDRFLNRWIRAREHDLTKAEQMLRTSLEWRQENDIDDIHNWEIPRNILQDYPFVISGLDKEGCPVGIFPLGEWDVKKAVESGLRDTYIKYVDHIMGAQFGGTLRNKCGPNVDQVVIILDMKGYSFRQVTALKAVDAILETVRRFDLNYPETLKLAVVINAPRIFSIIFGIIKPVLSAKTLSKVEIFNYDPEKWMPFLSEFIPLSSLPTSFGGTNSEAENILTRKVLADVNGNLDENLEDKMNTTTFL
jgi:hypothetical protein